MCAGRVHRIAIFAAAIAMSQGLEIVIFSPARRASRKLLERITEFVRLLGFDDRIMEFNQEQLRVRSLSGKTSLIRSFPSKVSVSSNIFASDTNPLSPRTPMRTCKHPQGGKNTPRGFGGGQEHTRPHNLQ